MLPFHHVLHVFPFRLCLHLLSRATPLRAPDPRARAKEHEVSENLSGPKYEPQRSRCPTTLSETAARWRARPRAEPEPEAAAREPEGAREGGCNSCGRQCRGAVHEARHEQTQNPRRHEYRGRGRGAVNLRKPQPRTCTDVRGRARCLSRSARSRRSSGSRRRGFSARYCEFAKRGSDAGCERACRPGGGDYGARCGHGGGTTYTHIVRPRAQTRRERDGDK